MAHPAEKFKIFCILDSETDDVNHAFPVNLPKTETVGDLKKAIMKETNPLNEHDARSLILNLTSVLLDGDFEENIRKAARTELRPADQLDSIFPTGPQKGRVYIIVRLPPELARKRKLSPSMTVSDPVVVKRSKIFTSESIAPSTFGKPVVYAKLDPEKYAFNRPPSTETIPLALLHETFGRFVKNAQTHVPTAADNALVWELRQVMSVVYETEAKLCHGFQEAVEKHYDEIQFETPATSHQSGGHVRYQGFLYSVTEGKLLGEGVGDPEVQACGYFVTSIKELYADNKGDFPDLFPCLIIYFTGWLVCFSGAVVTDRVHLETLTPTFSLHANVHESEIALQAARAFGAFRLACRDLRAYYGNLALEMSGPTRPEARRLLFPYEDHYMTGGGEHVKFDYLERLHTTKLIFTGRNSKGDELFIKFTRHYSTDAHQYCSDKGIAPKLYAVKELPGGWMMVVTEFLGDNAYIPPRASKVETAILRDGLKTAVDILHQGDFVHGDIRDANVLVKTQWDTIGIGNVRLVDFDWAGQVDKAKYPPNVNFLDIKRPVGVRDGELITKEHDFEMLGYIFPKRYG